MKQQYQQLCRIFATIPKQWGWDIASTRGFPLPWGLGNYLGIIIPVSERELTTERLAWFAQQECIVQVDGDKVILAPQVKVDPPRSCFHTTLIENMEEILSKDLVTGAIARRSTSKRTDCQDYIYVSFTLDSARAWTGSHLLGKENPGQQWGIIRIESEGLATKCVFRDPCSADGYILMDKRVDKRFLHLVEKYSPHHN
jgi:hypothetical protein